MDTSKDTLREVQNYYGETLGNNGDLKTSACCSTESVPDYQKEILKQIDDEVLIKFYGCGSPIPLGIEGKTVLDLGCGTGRDVYLAAKLVGPEGFVIGVDMTDNQLAVAERHVESQTTRFGFSKPNVDFRKGFIENLAGIGIEDNSVDVVISNCVINLSPEKEKVFSEIFRVLKPGGELYFSDVFTDRRVPDALRRDPVLYGECLSGAMYTEDFRRLMQKLGCLDHRVLSSCKIELNNAGLEEKAGMINFYSQTIRAFKLDTLEDICEDYGQIAFYKGTIKHAPHAFVLDDHHTFPKGKPALVCGNTASMLEETRFADHFEIIGDHSVHFGAFDCSGDDDAESSATGGCC